MKKAWVLVAANLVVALLVVLVVFAILTALGAFASYVTTWPLFVLLGCGVTLCTVAARAIKNIQKRKARCFASIVNGSALALYAVLIGYAAWTRVSGTTERFILPLGYQGEVYVVHSVPGGAPEERTFFRTRTYRIPDDGVLLSQVPLDMGWTRDEYYYQSRDGKLIKIRYAWYSTIASTPANLANNRDVGMYFPRTAYGGDNNSGCTGPSDLFEIGTPAFLLSNHPQVDFSGYLAKHAAECVKH
jgi:hypothetical protein